MTPLARLLDASYFELFGLPERYALVEAELAARHERLRTSAHPDRHIGMPAQQAAAEQLAARINEAYRTLSDPLLRAAYLLMREGKDPFAEGARASMPADFLEQQLELREQLEDARGDPAAVARLSASCRSETDAAFGELAAAFAGSEPDFDHIADLARKIKYLRNFGSECAAAAG